MVYLMIRECWHAAQKEDLARMYRLFQRIVKGLDPVADAFKRHVEGEGLQLVKQVTEAAASKKDKDAGGAPCLSYEQEWVGHESSGMSLAWQHGGLLA